VWASYTPQRRKVICRPLNGVNMLTNAFEVARTRENQSSYTVIRSVTIWHE